jgi:DNA-binding LacI/PurR family transcriptional regulator
MPGYTIDPDPLPKYYHVYVSLLDRIRSGEFGTGDMLPPEWKLVNDYGVSRITVIKALDLLEREGIIDRQQGRGSFVMNDKEPNEDLVKKFRVAFCLPTYAESHITSVLIGAAGVAIHEGLQLEVIGVDSDEREAHHIRTAIERGVDGILIYSRARIPDIELYRELQERHFPLVMLDRYYPECNTDWVIFDDEGAGYALTQHLIQKGHRRIGILPGHEIQFSSVRGRIQGYRRALETAGIDYDENLVCLDIYNALSPDSAERMKSSYQQLHARIRQYNITAIIAINFLVLSQISIDMIRIKNELLNAIIEGQEEPGADQMKVDIVAISHQFPGSEQTALVALAHQSGERLGEQGMKILLQRLRGNTLLQQHVVLPMEIITLS